MCNICDDFKANKITSEQAFERIFDALQDQSDSEKTGHLMELSADILDKDVPMTEANAEMDKDWWEKTHPWDGHED